MSYTIITNDIYDLKKWLFKNEKIKVISFKEFLKSPQKADLVYFSGGEDVSPDIYGELTHPTTYSHPKRDMEELLVYYKAKELGISQLGVCRGCQFLTSVQDKGRLVQNVSHHSMYGTHEIKDKTSGKVVTATSTHHQMMYPFNVPNYQLIAVSSPNRSTIYEFGNPIGDEEEIINKFGEPEVVYYPDTKCLAIQGHPEYYELYSDDYPTYCRNLVFNKLWT